MNTIIYPSALNESFPLENLVKMTFRKYPAYKGGKESGYSRKLYLDLAEPIVRRATEWLTPSGSIIDPFEGAEPPTISARFIGAAGGLIGAGRCQDLITQTILVFDYAVEQLTTKNPDGHLLHGADFYIKEMAWAYHLLSDTGIIDPQVLERWRTKLQNYIPENVYTDIIRPGKDAVHNFNIYALTGEYWRYRTGLGPYEQTVRFVDEYIPRQFKHFTPWGMYRDPNNPITYDITVRQNLSLLLYGGYDGPYRAAVDELLRRGALTMLFFTAPNGQAPFGGRSNQYHHQEAMIACIAEYEARRYAELGEMALAGAFKRLARQAVATSIRFWQKEPWRDLKNAFHPITRHGREGYGEYSVYSLLAASLYGVAYHLADDTIPEAPLPAELAGTSSAFSPALAPGPGHGYVFDIGESFHKVFATYGGYHLEIDTKADLNYDATGLGRLVHVSFPMELGLSMPLCGNPSYAVVPCERQYAAIGPIWKKAGDKDWTSLAGQNTAEVALLLPEPDNIPEDANAAGQISFQITWQGMGVCDGAGVITQKYVLDAKGVTITTSFALPEEYSLGFEIPLLLSDGEETTRLERSTDGFRVIGSSGIYKVTCLNPVNEYQHYLKGERQRPPARRLPRAANRNGVYRLGLFIMERSGQGVITMHFAFDHYKQPEYGANMNLEVER